MKKSTIDISPAQYAKWKGCEVQYIHKLLKDEQWAKLPFIIKVKKYSRFYTLEVPSTLTANDFKVLMEKSQK